MINNVFSKRTSVWFQMTCPHCEKENWVSQGRDMDPDSVSCWDCHKVFYSDENFIISYYGIFCESKNPTLEQIIEEVAIDQQDGMESPLD